MIHKSLLSFTLWLRSQAQKERDQAELPDNAATARAFCNGRRSVYLELAEQLNSGKIVVGKWTPES